MSYFVRPFLVFNYYLSLFCWNARFYAFQYGFNSHFSQMLLICRKQRPEFVYGSKLIKQHSPVLKKYWTLLRVKSLLILFINNPPGLAVAVFTSSTWTWYIENEWINSANLNTNANILYGSKTERKVTTNQKLSKSFRCTYRMQMYIYHIYHHIIYIWIYLPLTMLSFVSYPVC